MDRTGTPSNRGARIRCRFVAAGVALGLSILVLAACSTQPTAPSVATATGSLPGQAPVAEEAPARQSVDTPTPPAIPTPAPTHPAAPAENHQPANKLGLHLLLDDGRNQWPAGIWRSHMEYARQAVGEWGYVVELVRLDDLQPDRWQHFMDVCAELHLTPILRLATVYDRQAGWWTAPPADADGGYRTVARQYSTFVTSLRWPTPAHTVVVGNEPNHGNEWSGRPDPGAYARFLGDVATALHEADPGARVLNAGLDLYTPNTGDAPFADGLYYVDEETFLDQMHAADPAVFTYLDAWASHSYPMGPMTQGPWQQALRWDSLNGASPAHAQPPPGIHNRGINGYEWELYKLSTYGITGLDVLITETGWRHAESTDPAATDNGRPLPTVQETARYLDLALNGNDGRYPKLPQNGWTPWLADPRVLGVALFALDGVPAEWGHTNWLALDPSGTVLEPYALFDLLAADRAGP